MRKIIQLTPETENYYPMALCNDGTVWFLDDNDKWVRIINPIPQDKEKNK